MNLAYIIITAGGLTAFTDFDDCWNYAHATGILDGATVLCEERTDSAPMVSLRPKMRPNEGDK